MRWHKSTPIETDDEAEKGERNMLGKYKRICDEACKAINGWGQFSDSPDTLVAAINKATNDSHNKGIRAEELAKELKLLQRAIWSAFGWSAPAEIDGVYRYVHSCGWEFRFKRDEATHEIPPPPEVCPRCFAVVDDDPDETEEEDTNE